MKLNNIISAFFALMGMVSFSACDNIAEDDRYIPVEKPVVPIEEVSKTLLIQEFTGVRCPNCPSGAQALHSIQEAYPDNVIIVGLHPKSGGFTTPFIPTQNFQTAEAEFMYNVYKPSGFPTAVFNGKDMSSAYATWLSIASGYIGNIANMSITADCNFDADTRNLSVDYSIDFTHDISNSDGYSVMVWIMENKIIGLQDNGGTPIIDYEHNHVLRGSLDGEKGKNIGTSFKARDNYSGNASMTLPENWVADNCQVVVYVFNASNYETEQAAIADVCQQ